MSLCAKEPSSRLLCKIAAMLCLSYAAVFAGCRKSGISKDDMNRCYDELLTKLGQDRDVQRVRFLLQAQEFFWVATECGLICSLATRLESREFARRSAIY